MMKVWPAAVARAKEEVAEMQKIADADKAGHKIEPWDYRHYAEKVRKAKYDLDQNEVKQYLQLEKLREGMFWVAGELFGFAFAPVAGLLTVAVLAVAAIAFLGRGAMGERVRQTSAQLANISEGQVITSRLTLYQDTWRMAAGP